MCISYSRTAERHVQGVGVGGGGSSGEFLKNAAVNKLNLGTSEY